MKSRNLVRVLVLAAVSVFVFASCQKDDVKVTANATISGFSPSSGSAGTVVVITGTNFSTTVSSNSVSFNGTHATVSAATAGQITATCPAGATTGKITVTVAGGGGTATSSGNFTVNP